ncbi:hypothetical protein M8J77_004691 [Diaphorina citri]|nr:hypothetical protein M8J77_004691 [Diaphorina citri]
MGRKSLRSKKKPSRFTPDPESESNSCSDADTTVVENEPMQLIKTQAETISKLQKRVENLTTQITKLLEDKTAPSSQEPCINSHQAASTPINIEEEPCCSHDVIKIPTTEQVLKPTVILNMPTLDTLLPRFSNDPNQSPSEFIQRVEEIFTTYSIPASNWILLLGPQFEGVAKSWYNSVSMSTKSYPDFKREFMKKFDSLDTKIKLKAEFFGQTQKDGEPTKAFIQHKMSLLKRLYGPVTDHNEAIAQIKELLHPKVKVHYLILPNTLEEFKERGDIIDQALTQPSTFKPQPTKPTYSDKPQTSKGQPKVPKCKYCPNQFHFYKECPNLKNTLNYMSETTNPLFRIRVTMDGKNLTALLDNGANPNFIKKSVVSKEEIVFNKPMKTAAQACGAMVEVIGHVSKLIQIGKTKFHYKFSVVENLVEEMILGIPFLLNEKCIMDFDRKCLVMGNRGRETIYALGVAPQKPQTFDVNLEDVKHGFQKSDSESLYALLKKHDHIFNSSGPLQQTDAIIHTIKMKTEKPIYVKPYKVSYQKEEIIATQIQEMLDHRIIEESVSPYNSPIVVVTKEGKEPRFCIDFRKINENSYDEDCQTLNIKDLINKIGDKKVFSSLDLRKGYWQVELDEDSKQYTAFSSPDGRHWQFRVLAFGLKGAPGTFMRLMNKVLGGYIGKFCEVFLDDIIVYSHNIDEHLHHLDLVFERLSLYKLTTSLKKCHFGKQELNYLGYVITSDNNQVQPAHVMAIQNIQPPKTKRQLQSIIGTMNWLRDYLPKAAEVMAPLTSIIARKPFSWTEKDSVELEKIKERFKNLDPLHRPKANLPMILQTDASGLGLAATLYQEEDGKKMIITNASCKLNATQRNYHINEQECLAVVWGINKFKSYLDGRHFILRTDSRALTWLHKFKEDKSKLIRWALLLQEYTFSIEHVKGRNNELPDAMSRSPWNEEVGSENEDWERMVFPPTQLENVQQLHSLEEKDILEQIRKTQEEMINQNILDSTDKYKKDDGILYFKTKGTYKILIPRKMVPIIIKLYHDDPLYSHPGRDQTLKAIQRTYTWSGMTKDVSDYVKKCSVCARVKTTGRINSSPLTPRTPVGVMHTVCIDLMGPYTRSTKGKRFLLVATDNFSKWTEAYPLSSSDTKKIISSLEQEFFCRFGYPQVIISDNGSQFTSKMFKNACDTWKIKHYTTATYCPRQNPTERENQKIKNKLRMFLLDEKNHKKWDENIPKILFSLRTSENAGTKHTPAEILFGKNLRHPLDVCQIEQNSSQDDCAEQRRVTRSQTDKMVKDNLKDYQTRYSGSSENKKELQVGQEVYVRNHALSSAVEGKTASLSAQWIGPFIIKQHISANTYLCQALDDPQDLRKVDLAQIQTKY